MARGGRPKGKKSGADGKPKAPKGTRSIPGFHSVNEAMRVRPESILSFWVRKDFDGIRELIDIVDFAKSRSIRIDYKSAQELNRLVSGHQGVVAHVSDDPELDWEDLKSRDRALLVALDGIEDPHNLGAILRTAWLMKAQGLLVPEARSVQLTPGAIKVASGGAEHVPVQVESNLPSVLKSLKDIGFWIFGLSHKAPQDIWDVEYPEKVVWVIGSEGKGMRSPVEKACDELISIPQLSASASYNASVSAAIALAETQRQWQHH